MTKCPDCGGWGETQYLYGPNGLEYETCPRCEGTGKIASPPVPQDLKALAYSWGANVDVHPEASGPNPDVWEWEFKTQPDPDGPLELHDLQENKAQKMRWDIEWLGYTAEIGINFDLYTYIKITKEP